MQTTMEFQNITFICVKSFIKIWYNYLQPWINWLPGQSLVLQSWVSILCPWQSAPPWAGSGFEQVLYLVWVPPPQVAEHSDHSPNSVHPPSTASVTWLQFIINYYGCSWVLNPLVTVWSMAWVKLGDKMPPSQSPVYLICLRRPFLLVN